VCMDSSADQSQQSPQVKDMFRSQLTHFRSIYKSQNLQKIVPLDIGSYVFLVMTLCHLLFSQVVTMINCYCHIDVLMENHLSACMYYTHTINVYI